MILLGAVGGDIVGSSFVNSNNKSKDVELFTDESTITGNTVATMGTAIALVRGIAGTDIAMRRLLPEETVMALREYCRAIPDAGYSESFQAWIDADKPEPYEGSGSDVAARVSACGWAGQNPEDVAEMAMLVAEPTHNSDEGKKGAVAAAMAVYYARKGLSRDNIREALSAVYDLDFTLDDIRDGYEFSDTSAGTVPQALVAFLEADSYETALRNAISLGGDTATLAAIAGAIAEAYYGIPEDMQEKILSYLEGDDKELLRRGLEVFNTDFEMDHPGGELPRGE